jgi:glycosyltransferase involved in cell wall biosynthesis
MRVGIFCDAFLPDNKAVAIRMYHLAQAFKQRSDVVVHTSTKQTSKFDFSLNQNVCGAPSSDSGAIRRLIAELALGVEIFFRIFFSRYQIVVISSPPFFTGFLGVLAARLRKVPYVFDVRDEYPEVYFTAGLLMPDSFGGKLLLRIERFIYKKALVVSTVTEGIQQRILSKIGEHKVELVRNGFDEDLFSPSQDKESVFTVVFHGNIGKFQNPELIIELARLAHEKKIPINFKVIGWGNNDSSLKDISLPNLKYYGMVEYKKIPSLISQAHIGISFRSSDIISVNSFPVKLYEYMGVGIPMIITPISEAGDFLEEKKLGFQFSGENPREILEKIEEVSRHTELLNELTANVKAIRHQFSRQAISQLFVEKVFEQSFKRL